VREVHEREGYSYSDEHEGSERGVNRFCERGMKEKDIDLVMEGTERRVNRYSEGGV